MKILIDLSIGKVNNKAMTLSLYNHNHHLLSITEWKNNKEILEFDLNLPIELKFKTDGKHKFDTIVDDSGNIIADKFIRIDGICVDGRWIKTWMLEGKLIQFTENLGDTKISNYFGKNGIGMFSIPYEDLLEFWLETMIDQFA